MPKRKTKTKTKTTTRQRTRVHRVLLALTDDEYRRLSEAASAMSLPVGVYARVVLFRALEAGEVLRNAP